MEEAYRALEDAVEVSLSLSLSLFLRSPSLLTLSLSLSFFLSFFLSLSLSPTLPVHHCFSEMYISFLSPITVAPSSNFSLRDFFSLVRTRWRANPARASSTFSRARCSCRLRSNTDEALRRASREEEELIQHAMMN